MFQGNSRGSVDYALRIAAEVMLLIFLFLELYSTWIKDYEYAEITTVGYFYIMSGGRVRSEMHKQEGKTKCIRIKKKSKEKQ